MYNKIFNPILLICWGGCGMLNNFLKKIENLGHDTPVTLQAVCPAVRRFTWRRNSLQGCHVPYKIWCVHYTTGDIIHIG